MTEDLIRTSRLAGGAVARATLAREKPLNSLLLATIDQLTEFLDQAESDNVRGILLDSSTPRAFCAGADITALYHNIRTEGGAGLAAAEAFFLHEYRLDYRLHRSVRPTITWGEGIVMGGGLGLLSGCSHRVGTPETRLAMPEITIGLFPDAGGTHLLSHLPDHLGLFIGLTGCQISAWDALALDLLDYVVPAGSRETFEAGLENINWSDKHHENDDRVRSLLSSLSCSDTARYQLLRFRAEIQALMNTALAAPDFFAEFEAGLDKLPDDEWLQAAIETYRNGCPATARIFVEQMQRAETQSLAEMFQMELTIAYQCIRHPDFAEGVRALLVDKDRNPSWAHASTAAVTDEYVEAHFTPSWTDDHPLQL